MFVRLANVVAIRRKGTLRRSTIGLLWVVAGLTLCPALLSQDGFIDREAKIKAAYLYQFIRYVQWPADTFADSSDPLVIATVGETEVSDYLRVIADKRDAGGRPLVFYQFPSPADMKGKIHILFVPAKASDEMVEEILRKTAGEPVLLVGETEHFAQAGGVLAFTVVDNNVKLQLSIRSATDRRLKVSSQLAKLAQIVH